MESGGSERQTLNLLRGLDRSIVDPQLYLLYREGSLLEELPSDVKVTDFWSSHRQPTINWPGRISKMQVRHLSQTICDQQAQVIYDRLFHMALIAGPAARRTGVGRIATIVSPPSNDLMLTERRFVWIKRLALARSYRSADRLIAVSQGTADDATRFYKIDPARFEVIQNPIDIDRVDRLKQEEWDGLPMRSDRRTVLSIGRLSEEKGHATLLEAVSHLIRNTELQIELHLIGDGPLRNSLEQRAVFLGIREHVVFHGQVANPFPLLRRAELFVLPSRYEGLPNALLEAMACEVPTLVSDCPGGIQDATDRGKHSRMVPIGDVAAMSRAIRDRFQSPEAWLEKLSAARKHIEQAHSLSRWLEKMQSVFVEVANEKPSRGLATGEGRRSMH
jgi:glycosyltransferase involved in cell wall biosynthesis